MQELLEALEGATNVKGISFDKESNTWEIFYHSGEPNKVSSDLLIDFLNNG